MNYWLLLASVEKLGPIKKKRLLERLKKPEAIFAATKDELLSVDGIGEEIIKSIENSKEYANLKRIEKIEKYMKDFDIKIINIDSEEYPSMLKAIYDSPITLFAKGNLNLLHGKNIAIVGARNASEYGLKIACRIGSDLSKNGVTVISGLAKGIDAAAHKGALSSSNNTIAVIGSGLNYIYPSENYSLYQEIAQKGLILSEYIIDSKPIAINFPARNRIISGLSEAIIVVEATKKSGALITVDFALEQGKSVYAVPGNINSKQSEGTNELIKNGAIPYTNREDLFLL